MHMQLQLFQLPLGWSQGSPNMSNIECHVSSSSNAIHRMITKW